MYQWLLAFHIIAVIAWMAGMLYLPRLFVYHCDADPGSRQSETFKVMERRLLRAIINPAMIVTWVIGLWLAWRGGFFSAPWLHAKLALVIGMSSTALATKARAILARLTGGRPGPDCGAVKPSNRNRLKMPTNRWCPSPSFPVASSRTGNNCFCRRLPY